MLFIVIIGVITALLLLAFLRERDDRRYAEWVSNDLREYTGRLRLRLLDAVNNLAIEKVDAFLTLASQRDEALDDLAVADELIEELDDIAVKALDGWTRADSIAERAVAMLEFGLVLAERHPELAAIVRKASQENDETIGIPVSTAEDVDAVVRRHKDVRGS